MENLIVEEDPRSAKEC